MISADLLSNVIAYSAQLAAIVGAAALLSLVVPIDAAGVRYAYWRAVGALCVALPFLQIMYRPATGGKPGSTAAVTAIVTAVVQSGSQVNWIAIALWLLAAGAILRLAWVAAGLIRLHRLRATAPGGKDTLGLTDTASPCASDLPSSIPFCGAEFQKTLGTRADVRYVAAMAHPVTFGLLRPVILLPAHLREQRVEIQRAVLGHELLHVQRRDWAWLVVEEIVRAALWFHPAAWWLISRIQLAREEAVDELAVLLTGQRKTYVEALLAFADSTSLVPTAAFARDRDLFRRITLVSKEAVMSSRRIAASCATLGLVLGTGSWYAVSAFPLVQSGAYSSGATGAPGPLELRAVPVTPENPIPRRVSFEAMVYPPEAAAVDAAGDVTLTITLDELGRVAEARPDPFGMVAPAFEVTRAYSGTGSGAEQFKGVNLRSGNTTAPMAEVFGAITRAATDAVKQWRYDPPFKAPISFPVTLRFGKPPAAGLSAVRATASAALTVVKSPDGSVLVRSADGTTTPYRRATPGPTAAAVTPGQDALRVGAVNKTPAKIKDVRPVYPPIAVEAKVQGVVIIELRIEPDGHVGDARVLRSIPLLDQAALDAVMQWEFTPTLLNGAPVPIMTVVTVNFTLQ
ncbi:MAG: TonB family protein [Acidobacteriota bacterium]